MEFKEQIDAFIQKVVSCGKVLDLGCGGGYISFYLANNGLNPIGIDFSLIHCILSKEARVSAKMSSRFS